MGGTGSGRHWQFGADTTDSYRSIDVRWLKREGILNPGESRQITWSRNGEVTGSINVRAEQDRMILTYRHRSNGSDWKDACYPVRLEATPCHMGGERSWFLCPGRGCGKRVAVLYGGEIFACRHCHQLVYPSQRENQMDRATRRADRIRDKLGWPGGILEGSGWGKPKGMHWRTYERLSDEHDTFVNAVSAAFMDRFGHREDAHLLQK